MAQIEKIVREKREDPRCSNCELLAAFEGDCAVHTKLTELRILLAETDLKLVTSQAEVASLVARLNI